MKILTFLLILFITIANAQNEGQTNKKYFNEGSLRIDYLRRGNSQKDSIHTIQFKKEIVYGGSYTKTIEPFDYGYYRVSLYDSVSGTLIATHSYSSLFQEYKFTKEGKTEIKEFQETVRFPFPDSTVKIVFSKRNPSDNKWYNTDSTFFNPHKTPYSITPITFFKTDYQSLHYSGLSNKRFDVVLVAEGYTINEREKFYMDALRIKDYLLECEPYASYKNKINVWALYTPSEQSGVSQIKKGQFVNTALGLSFFTLNSERYLMTENVFKLKDICSIVPYDAIVVLVNTDNYGGGGIYNQYAAIPVDNPYSDFLLVHEFGHSFAGLGDEYYSSDVSVIDYYNISLEPWEPNITTLVNFDGKWKDLLPPDAPIPTPLIEPYPQVGVFEGAAYREKGIYRPAFDCTMKSVQFDNFCPVCRRSIIKMINFYAE